MSTEQRDERLAALDLFVGEWIEQVEVPDAPPGRSSFEWDLRGTVMIQRAVSPLPEYPDGLMVISLAPDGYLQHYFDSRGVARLYRMSLTDRTWTLLRTEPDFTPLDFAQRFVGTISPDGNRIDGQWETSYDQGQSWEVDFPLSYTRVQSERQSGEPQP
jgi:hypothetical protein